MDKINLGPLDPFNMKKMTEGELYQRRAESLGKFSDLLKGQLSEINQMGLEAEDMQKSFLAGDPNVSMVELMTTIKKADQAFKMLLEVRNKLVDAYNQIMQLRV